MAKASKLGLDEATLRIARRMLSSPPKPHEEMKLGKPRAKSKKNPAQKTTKKPSR